MTNTSVWVVKFKTKFWIKILDVRELSAQYALVGNRPRSWRAVNRQKDNELAASQGKILDLKNFNKIFQTF